MNIKKMWLLVLLLIIGQNTYTESLLSQLWSVLFSRGFYSCTVMYNETNRDWKKNHSILLDPILKQNITSNSAFYIDHINKKIIKREEFGEKCNFFDTRKIIVGITEIWLSIFFLKLSIDHKFRYMPISIIFGYNGINNTLNGSIRYRMRMETKLARDRKLRKRLLKSLHDLKGSINLDLNDNRTKMQKTLDRLYRAAKLIVHKIKPENLNLLIACATGYLISGYIYRFATKPFTFNIQLTLNDDAKKIVNGISGATQDIIKTVKQNN